MGTAQSHFPRSVICEVFISLTKCQVLPFSILFMLEIVKMTFLGMGQDVPREIEFAISFSSELLIIAGVYVLLKNEFRLVGQPQLLCSAPGPSGRMSREPVTRVCGQRASPGPSGVDSREPGDFVTWRVDPEAASLCSCRSSSSVLVNMFDEMSIE